LPSVIGFLRLLIKTQKLDVIFTPWLKVQRCGFNRSMQHLVSKRREEDVADEEVPKEDSLHRNRQSTDVGSLAERRFSGKDRTAL
jgi:hypothetical protein